MQRLQSEYRVFDAAACIGCAVCVTACPKGIKLENIVGMNRDCIKASLTYRPDTGSDGGS